MIGRVTSVLKDPEAAWLKALARMDKQRLFSRYHQLAARAGLRSLFLILSFDCDTEEDIHAAPLVYKRLKAMGVKVVFAVPGQLLERGIETYRPIYEDGAEFLNHGYTEHTFFDTAAGRHASCFFYDELPRERVRQDIEEGHACVTSLLGAPPAGFRTPHFGSFQKPDELRFLYSVLRGLGCRFSSSTSPIFGFRNGPVSRQEGIFELPVSGMWSMPFTILDSWAFFAAPDRTMGPEDFVREGRSVAEAFQQNGWYGILNVYADPSHVAGQDAFFDTVKFWSRLARSVTYDGLFKELNLAAA